MTKLKDKAYCWANNTARWVNWVLGIVLLTSGIIFNNLLFMILGISTLGFALVAVIIVKINIKSDKKEEPLHIGELKLDTKATQCD